MATKSNRRLKVTELDFDLVKENLRDFMGAQSEFTDYDFEGAGINILMELLAYNTHFNGFYANMIANESYLDTATQRDSVVSLAKHLSYVPRSQLGARATLDLAFTPNDLGGYDSGVSSATSRLGTNVVIPKGSIFTSTLENLTYSYVTTKSYTATPTANSTGGFLVDDTSTSSVVPYTAKDVEVVQGVYTSIQYVFNEQVSQRFIIPNSAVDTTTISVVVTDSLSSSSGTIYTLVDDFVALDQDSDVFFLQEISGEKYEIYFGDGVIGSKPKDGNVIDISYVVSEGEIGNGATIFESDPIKSPFYGIDGSTRTYAPTVTTVIAASGGSEREGIESIKYLGPLNYEAQNRAVTAPDYVVKLKSEYSSLDAVHSWGGEDNIPPNYGKVYISIKPKNGYVLTNTEKTRIKNEILKAQNMITIEPILVDPSYIFIVPTIRVKWDSKLTTLTEQTLRAGVADEIVRWSEDNLETFDTYFRYSVLLRTIDEFSVGIVNSTANILLRAEISPTVGISGSYEVLFNNPIFRPSSTHTGSVSSTTFNYAGYISCSLFDEDGIIKIRGVSSSGDSAVISENAGTVNYTTGKIFLSNFIPTSVDNGGVLSITMTPFYQDIVPGNNQLLAIRDSDLTIRMQDDSSTSGTLSTIRDQVGAS